MPNDAAVGPVPLSVHEGKKTFTRGAGERKPVSWFAIPWLWTNARHLIASGIAVDDIDSRDWMTPDEPEELVARVARVLGADPAAETLAGALGREVWVDYVADTGDDDTVSGAVASLVARRYEVTDESGRLMIAPRGDVLCFGGDTAYPVATPDEIRHRLVGPWNAVLAERDDGVPRAILGIPGNHDWNDGLDGFGRLFRHRQRVDVEERPDAEGLLALHGYEPVQDASYFNLPLAPGIEVWGVDRQLRHVDHRQRQFFARTGGRGGSGARILMQADPHRVFGLDNAAGRDAVARLGLRLRDEPHLVLAGDIHQYQRWEDGRSMHVTAGGGGASLHGAAGARGSGPSHVSKEFPTAADCKPLLGEAFWRTVTGKAGWFVHVAIGVVTLLFCALLACPLDRAGLLAAGGVLLVGAVLGARAAFGPRATFAALVLGLAIAATPLALGWFYPAPLLFAGDVVPVLLSAIGAGLLGGTAAAWAVVHLARRGIDNYLAWAALAHPGFKHFLRLRVRADGSAIDAWCLGLRDPCAAREPVVLVDQFTLPAKPAG